MDSIRGYLLSVVAACLLYAVCNALLRGEALRRVMRLAGGVLVLLVVLTPLVSLRFDGIKSFLRDFEETTEFDIEASQRASKEAINERVRAAAEAYIEEKALAWGITVQAKVRLSDDEYPVPSFVTLIGNLSVNQASELSELITKQLGIPAECQEWKIYGSSE